MRRTRTLRAAPGTSSRRARAPRFVPIHGDVRAQHSLHRERFAVIGLVVRRLAFSSHEDFAAVADRDFGRRGMSDIDHLLLRGAIDESIDPIAIEPAMSRSSRPQLGQALTKAEGRRQQAEGSRQKAEGSRQKAEGSRQPSLLLPSAFCLLPFDLRRLHALGQLLAAGLAVPLLERFG